jgi:hypothetical protein
MVIIFSFNDYNFPYWSQHLKREKLHYIFYLVELWVQFINKKWPYNTGDLLQVVQFIYTVKMC